MKPDSLEGSIQSLLSALFPPFEATAPTVLSQLFQVIEGRYHGDALRCLLDFLVPAKHILETVQQAACAQYSDVVFLCEGWPLCLREKVVVHLAPVSPLLLQPGDFYLQVAPFSNQSARIVVCSLLEEEGLREEVVEETPVPETSYPCIFSPDWLGEINQDRHGTPLSQCLLATEWGVVRLPWEQVAVPEFVDVPQRGTSMASVPHTPLPIPPPLPPPPPPPSSSPAAVNPKDCPTESRNPPLPRSPSKASPSKPTLSPPPSGGSESKPSPHPSAFSVETRICPAKHGIAVSLCLVDTSTAASSRLVKVNEREPKPIGWVSPNTWDSRCTGIDTATGTSVASGSYTAASTGREKNTSTDTGKSEGIFASTVLGQDTHTSTQGTSRSADSNQNTHTSIQGNSQNTHTSIQGNSQNTHTSIQGNSGAADIVNSFSVAEGEYIDILQAALLFGGAQAPTQAQQQHGPMQPHTQAQMQPHTQAQMQPHTQAQMQPHTQAQMQPHTQAQMQPHTQAQMQPHTQAQMQPHTQAQMQPHTQAQMQPHTQAQMQPHTQRQAQMQPHTQAQMQPHTHSQAQMQPHTHSQAQMQPHTHSQAQMQPHTQVQLQPHTQRQAQMQPHTQAQMQPHTHSQAQMQPHTHSQAQMQPHTHSQAQMQPHTQAQMQPHTQAQMQPHTQAQMQPHTQIQPHTQRQAPMQPHTQAQMQPHTQAQMQLHTQAQMQPHTQIQPHTQRQAQMQPHTQRQAQMQPHTQAQMQPHTQAQMQQHTQMQAQSESHTQTQAQPYTQTQPQTVQLPTKPQTHAHPRPGAAMLFRPGMSGEAGPTSAPHPSPSHHPNLHGLPNHREPPECARTIRFSEEPCTPCMKRRQGGKVSRAQELRCRYRESYQAAIQNPVNFMREKEREKTLSVVEEDSGSERRLEPPEEGRGDPCCGAPGRCCDPRMQNQTTAPVCGALGKEAGENNAVTWWTSGDENTVPHVDYRDANTLKCGEHPEQTTAPLSRGVSQRNSVPCDESRDEKASRSHGVLHGLNGTNMRAHGVLSSAVEPKWMDMSSAKPHGLSSSSSHPPEMNVNVAKSHGVSQIKSDPAGSSTGMNLNNARPHGISQNNTDFTGMNLSISKPHGASQDRSDPSTTHLSVSSSLGVSQHKGDPVNSDGRLSSLSTTVVDTSERCEVVMVRGQDVRRRDGSESSGEMVPRLHVVKCKNATAFGLVSPKISRKKMVNKDINQASKAPMASRDGHRMETQREIHPPPAENQQTPQPDRAPPRPNHLLLGSPDPRTYPLHLGIVCLTGGRDRAGRAVVEVYGDHQGLRPAVSSQELCQTLLYFHSIVRREIRELGMTLVVDGRKTPPPAQFYQALMTLQDQSPQAEHFVVLVLLDKDSSHRPERSPGIQSEVVTSLKALNKLVEAGQLTSCLDGTLPYSHRDWLELHQKLHPFMSDLHEASGLLRRAIRKLEETHKVDSVQNVQQSIVDQRTLMRDVLEDSRLVGLQREGGAILARLRRESDLRYPQCDDFSDAVDSVSSLYNHVEEQAHVLVQRSNMSLEHLQYLLQLRQMEGHFTQIREWFEAEGERHLLEAESVEDSRERVEQTLNSLTAFLIEANDRKHHAMSLVSEAERLQGDGLSYPETEVFRTLVCSFRSGLESFLSRAETCRRELQIMATVCDFCEQATALARECKQYLDQTESNTHPAQQQEPGTTTTHQPCTHPAQGQHHDPGQNASPLHQSNTQPTQQQDHGSTTTPHYQSNIHPAQDSGPTITPGHDIALLQAYQDQFLQFSPERFQEVKAQACALRGSRGMRVWNVAWLKCQQARQQLQERVQDVNEAYCQQHSSGGWCEHHNVDEQGNNALTVPPSGREPLLQSTPGPRHPQWEGIVSGSVDIRKRRPILGSSSSNSTTVVCCNINVQPDRSDTRSNKGSKVTADSHPSSGRRPERETRRRETSRGRSGRDAAALSQSHTVGCQWFPWGRALGARSASEDSCATVAPSPTAGTSGQPEPRVRSPSSCSHRGQPSCRILQEAQRFQISRHGSFCSEKSCTEGTRAAGDHGTWCTKHSSLPIRRCEGTACLVCAEESATNALRLQRVLEELVLTEREYVRSLGYILTHYHPLLDRPDIPQDLRGKRGVIFGNLEKLHDFHSHYFLPELEACQREPAPVARCFLRHRESFGLYALYSKNKPQSDALILHRRHDIFKRKQQELGDLMDLSSYLLRPIQRISKYSLLLQDMLALAGSHRTNAVGQEPPCGGPSVCGTHACGHSDCGSSVCDPSVCRPPCVCMPDVCAPQMSRERERERERERAEIQAAADLVRFQMRHGNDLLTMDAIQDCDVNLNEQGQLIRQDEFTVFFRKKKCVRRIFLFQDLILFSKTKKTDVGNDVYVYKQSFKTCDIGMTHNSGVSGLCFEIWFRRRKSEDTYTLRAYSLEVKRAWTTDLERILWEQAAHSRELRMQERVFMGIGGKPFMDIQPSEAAICDRAVNCAQPWRIPVACCSHRSLEYPRPNSIGSGSTASTTLSQSSSSSGRGSLPPLGYPSNQSQGAEINHAVCSSPEGVAENDLNNQRLHQNHPHHNCQQQKPCCHLQLDSTVSSGECISIFSSSEHSCFSAIGGEVEDSSSSCASQGSKPRPSLSRTSSLRKNGSPVVTRKKPTIAPKPPSLIVSSQAQDNEIIISKSTEV